jgi:hypothetical protein
VLICSERRVLLAGCWIVLREKYCWLVADKPSEHGLACMRKKMKTARSLFPDGPVTCSAIPEG